MGVQHSIVGDLRIAEPLFERPPVFPVAERRSAAHAEAAWQAACTPGKVPDAGTFGAMLEAEERAANIATIDLAQRSIVAAGCAITAAFGLTPGPLAGAGGLGARLDALCATVATGAPVRIEGRFAPVGSVAATLLTRAIILPVACGGVISRAYVVATWREGLASTAMALLRRDLAAAFVPAPRLLPTTLIFGRA